MANKGIVQPNNHEAAEPLLSLTVSALQAAGERDASAAAAAAEAGAIKLETRLAEAEKAVQAAEAKDSAARAAAAAAEGAALELRGHLAEAKAALSASKAEQVRPCLSRWTVHRPLAGQSWLLHGTACYGRTVDSHAQLVQHDLPSACESSPLAAQ